MKYLKEALRNLDKTVKPVAKKVVDEFTIALDQVLEAIDNLDNTDNSEPDYSSDNKGHFGGRSVSFKQDVYRIPEKPAGDHTQPVGLLTQSDLQNYVIFRAKDRLSFKYVSGTAGQCTYEYKKNGTDSFIRDIAFSDAVIQELVDDGALELV